MFISINYFLGLKTLVAVVAGVAVVAVVAAIASAIAMALPPPQTFLHEGEVFGVPNSVYDLY